VLHKLRLSIPSSEKNQLIWIRTYTYTWRLLKISIRSSLHWRVISTVPVTQRKYFDYFVFNIVDYGINCGLLRSGACCWALIQTISNARGLDINSPLSTETHAQDLWLHRHQQRDDPNNARVFDNNFASNCGCDSTISIRLRHRQLRRADHAASDKS
jgi:hypothetical protein